MRILQSDNPRPLNLLAIGPNGLVAAASNTFDVSGELDVWDAASGDERFFRLGVEQKVAISFSANAGLMFVAERHRLVILDTATSVRSYGPVGRFRADQVAFSVDGTRAVAAGVHDLDALEAQAHGGAPGGLECWAVAATGNVRAGDTRAFSSLWRIESVKFTAPAVSRDGSRVAAHFRSDGPSGRPDHRISLRDAATGAQYCFVSTDIASPVQQLAFTADGSKLLVRTDSRAVRLYDAATGAPAGELVHTGRPYVSGLAVHPRGPVACARTNGTVTFWDAEKREQLRTLDWKAGKLVSVTFSPDGELAAAGTEDGKVVVWDVDF